MSGMWMERVSHCIGPILLLSAANALFVRAYLDLLPSISDGIFNGGADALAVLSAAFGLGGLAGALIITTRDKAEGLHRLTHTAAICTAVLFLVFASNNVLWLGVVFIALMGVSDVILGTGLQMIVQTSVDDHIRGRVLSLHGLIVRVGLATGALLLGLLSVWIPLQQGLLLSAAIGLVIVILLGVRKKSIPATTGLPTPRPKQRPVVP